MTHYVLILVSTVWSRIIGYLSSLLPITSWPQFSDAVWQNTTSVGSGQPCTVDVFLRLTDDCQQSWNRPYWFAWETQWHNRVTVSNDLINKKNNGILTIRHLRIPNLINDSRPNRIGSGTPSTYTLQVWHILPHFENSKRWFPLSWAVQHSYRICIHCW